MADYDWGCDRCGARIVGSAHFAPGNCPAEKEKKIVQDPEQLAGHGYEKDTAAMHGMGPYNMYPPAYGGSHVHEPTYTPGTAPKSTTSPTGPWYVPGGGYGQYPKPEPIKVSDYYICPACGETVWSTMGGHHVCRPQPAGASGWACPACGQGNAPFVSQCPCGGRTGVSTTTNTVSVTPKRETLPECDCCGLSHYADEAVERHGYTVCWVCANGTHGSHPIDDPYWPIWHSHSDDGEPLGVTRSGKPRRRYQFREWSADLGEPRVGMTYFNDDDPDDYQ